MGTREELAAVLLAVGGGLEDRLARPTDEIAAAQAVRYDASLEAGETTPDAANRAGFSGRGRRARE